MSKAKATAPGNPKTSIKDTGSKKLEDKPVEKKTFKQHFGF